MDFSQNQISTGLVTITTAAPAAGPYVISGKLTLPTISEEDRSDLGTSQVVVTVAQNGSTVYTGLAGAEGFKANLLCAAFDVLTVSMTSSAAIDQTPNIVKAAISLSSGV